MEISVDGKIYSILTYHIYSCSGSLAESIVPCLCVCLSVFLNVSLSIFRFSVCLFLCLSISLSVWLSIMSFCLSVSLSIWLSLCLSVFLFGCLSVYMATLICVIIKAWETKFAMNIPVLYVQLKFISNVAIHVHCLGKSKIKVFNSLSLQHLNDIYIFDFYTY